MPNKKIMIMAGGTGGHVFPALSVAQALREQGHSVSWLGTKQGLEAKVIPDADIPLFFISVAGLRSAGIKRLLKAPFVLLLALYQALRILLREKPQLVLGMGGFASGPGGLAAFILRIPIIIHEQNAVPGFTNRVLGRLAKRVLQAFPDSFSKKYHAITTGNPVRKSISLITPPAERFAERQGALRLLVLGGSQGALSLNQLVPEAVAAMPVAERPEIWHQAGHRHHEATQADYQQKGIAARVDAFIKDMSDVYAWADIILCRSGALTVAEVMAAGVASILVPYPHAVDDHQRINGETLVKANAAVLYTQKEISAAKLTELLLSLQADRNKLLQMAEAARALSPLSATETVMQHCLEVARG